MVTKKKKKMPLVKTIDAASVEDWDQDSGRWQQEIRAWMEGCTLKGLLFSEDWVFICVDLISREISGIPRKVFQKIVNDGKTVLEPAEDHPLQPLLDNPNPWQDSVAFRYNESLEHTLMGNAILWHARIMNQMFILPAEQVRIEFARQMLPMYIFNPTVEDSFSKQSEITLSPADIIHVRRPNPNSLWWGLSPFVSARKSVLFNRYSQDYLNAFYVKGATPQLALSIEREANQEAINRMLKSFEMAHTGRRNMRRALLLPKGVTIQPVGLSVSDQQLIETIRMNRETILNVLHIPKHAVGLQESGSLGSQEHKQALRYFWQSTIIPIDKSINAAYNSHFKYLLGDMFVIASDYSAIGILQDDLKTQGELSKLLLETHTVNEVRAKLYNLPPVDGGDIVLNVARLVRALAHPAQQQATETQSQALTISDTKVSVPYEGVDFIPTRSVAEFARRGLELAEAKSFDDFLPIAKRLADRVPLDPTDVWFMQSFFAENTRTMYNVSEHGEPAPGKRASLLLGHTEGKRWSTRVLREMKQWDSERGLKSEAPTFEALAGLKFDGGINESELIISALKEKNNVDVSYEKLAQAEDKLMPDVEALALKLFNDFFDVGLDVVVDTFKKQKAFETPNDLPDDEVDSVSSKKLSKKLKEAFEKLKREWTRTMAEKLEAVMEMGYDSQLSLSFMEPAVEAILALRERDADERRQILRERGLESFANISKTTTERIMRVVERGVRDSRSIAEIGRKIAADFKAVSPVRAETIARTEVLTASSLGQAAAMRNAKELIPGLKKIWINAGDELVRGNPDGKYNDAEFDHWDVQNDGAIDANEPFSNGLQFPREPGGEAGNVINCRCRLLTLAPEDLDVIRIPKR
jgi:HK97 family phage portal protein